MLLNQHLSISSYVGPSVSLDPQFGTCVLDKQSQHPYGHTDMACHFPTLIPLPSLASLSPPHSTYFTATSMTLLNGNVCHIGDWVLFSLSVDNAEAPALGHIHEMIVDVARTQQYPRPAAILLRQVDIGEWVEPYRMPRIRISDKWAAADIVVRSVIRDWCILTFFIQQILCSANVQHQCHSHCCVTSGSEVIYQEWQATNQRQVVIVHNAPEDLLLNTTQMHDASHFSWHCVSIDVTALDFNSAIMNGAQQEVDSCKQANVSGRGLQGRGWVSNWGRGGSTSQN